MTRQSNYQSPNARVVHVDRNIVRYNTDTLRLMVFHGSVKRVAYFTISLYDSEQAALRHALECRERLKHCITARLDNRTTLVRRKSNHKLPLPKSPRYQVPKNEVSQFAMWISQARKSQ